MPKKILFIPINNSDTNIKEAANIKPPPLADGFFNIIPGCMCIFGLVTIPFLAMKSIIFGARTYVSKKDVKKGMTSRIYSGFTSGLNIVDEIKNILNAEKAKIAFTAVVITSKSFGAYIK